MKFAYINREFGRRTLCAIMKNHPQSGRLAIVCFFEGYRLKFLFGRRQGKRMAHGLPAEILAEIPLRGNPDGRVP